MQSLKESSREIQRKRRQELIKVERDECSWRAGPRALGARRRDLLREEGRGGFTEEMGVSRDPKDKPLSAWRPGWAWVSGRRKVRLRLVVSGMSPVARGMGGAGGRLGVPRCIAGVRFRDGGAWPGADTLRGAPRPLCSLRVPAFVRVSAPGSPVKPHGAPCSESCRSRGDWCLWRGLSHLSGLRLFFEHMNSLFVFPGGSDSKASACSATQVRSLSREDPLEKEMATTPVLLPGESHGRRSLVGHSPWGSKESDTTERLHFTHSLSE